MRIRASSAVLVLFLAALFVLAGCEPGYNGGQGIRGAELALPDPPPEPLPPDANLRWGTLYFTDSDRRFLVPVKKPIPFTEAIALSTLSHLVPDAAQAAELSSRGLAYVLPENTDIIGISIAEGQAKIDFNSSFLSYPPGDERLVMGSILCTMRQFPSVEQVKVVVEGVELEKFPGGTSGRLPLGPECLINLEVDDALQDYRQYTAATPYFCYYTGGAGIFYVPVTRVLPPAEDAAQAVFQELLKGPLPGSGLFSELPATAQLRGIDLKDGILQVDFSKELLAYRGGLTGAENLVNQVLLTAGSLEGVEKVLIRVEGEPVNLEGRLDLSQPLLPPTLFNCIR